MKFSDRALFFVLAFGCASRAVGPSTATTPVAGAPSPFEPPPPPAPAKVAATERPGPTDEQKQLRRDIIQQTWETVRDKHFDAKLGGVNWPAAREKWEPIAVAAPDDATFYRTVNQMLGELGQSHLRLTGPGSDPSAEETGGGDADPGLTVRIIENRPTVTAVRDGSSAEKAGLKPGFIVTHIGGWIPTPGVSPRPLRPVEERFAVRVAAARRLSGPDGSRVTVKFLDAQDRAGEVVLTREAPKGKPVRIGILAPMYPDVHTARIGDVGVVAFNLFLTEGVLPAVQKAIDTFRNQGVRGLVLDLRGNPGGLGAMAIPVAARLSRQPIDLGSIQFRDHANNLRAEPPLGVTPFTGPVVILTDEGTASTSEILAAGLQESGRALVVGDTSLGAALASAVQAMPGGAMLQYVVADFRTPKGFLIEGRGVQPNKRVFETRAALLQGRDVVLDAARVAARGSRP